MATESSPEAYAAKYPKGFSEPYEWVAPAKYDSAIQQIEILEAERASLQAQLKQLAAGVAITAVVGLLIGGVAVYLYFTCYTKKSSYERIA